MELDQVRLAFKAETALPLISMVPTLLDHPAVRREVAAVFMLVQALLRAVQRGLGLILALHIMAALAAVRTSITLELEWAEAALVVPMGLEPQVEPTPTV